MGFSPSELHQGQKGKAATLDVAAFSFWRYASSLDPLSRAKQEPDEIKHAEEKVIP